MNQFFKKISTLDLSISAVILSISTQLSLPRFAHLRILGQTIAMTTFIKQNFYFLPTAMLLFSAIAKLFLFDPTQVDLPLPGMAALMVPLGVLELVCILLFVYPRSMKLGFLLICCFLGGAIAVNLVGQLHSPLMPGLILALFWVGVYLKKPELFF